jgi:hypothetical protein
VTTGATAPQLGANADNESAGKHEWYGYFEYGNRVTRNKMEQESAQNQSRKE